MLFDQTWDLYVSFLEPTLRDWCTSILMNLLSISFYLYRASLDPNQQALLLVPTKQLEHFLATINRSLKTSLTIPKGGANGVFSVTFENDGTPQPRYLGRSTNREMAGNLKDNVPPRYYRYVYS